MKEIEENSFQIILLVQKDPRERIFLADVNQIQITSKGL